MTRTEIIEQTKDALGALEETGSDNWTDAERTEYLALAERLHTTEDAPETDKRFLAKQEAARARRRFYAYQYITRALRDQGYGEIAPQNNAQRVAWGNMRRRAEAHLLATLYADRNHQELVGYGSGYHAGWI